VLALVATQVVVVAGPAYAAAGTVSRSGSTLIFTAGSATVNKVHILLAGGVYEVWDFSGAPVTAAPSSGCVSVKTNMVQCVASGVAAIRVDLLDKNDSAFFENSVPVGATVNGGNGSDHLWGTQKNDVLDGDGGTDTLEESAGSDTLDGGPANDTFTIVDRPGSDTYVGGDGFDKLSFFPTTATGVHVTLDNGYDDGFGGNDNVRTDIEHVVGTGFADTLAGSNASNTLDGSAGNDWINGAGGADTLLGGSGNDTIFGGAGFDTIDGGPGTDTCHVEADGGSKVNCELGT
jgi:Ca2+-binding RTX toxin-like protein